MIQDLLQKFLYDHLQVYILLLRTFSSSLKIFLGVSSQSYVVISSKTVCGVLPRGIKEHFPRTPLDFFLKILPESPPSIPLGVSSSFLFRISLKLTSTLFGGIPSRIPFRTPPKFPAGFSSNFSPKNSWRFLHEIKKKTPLMLFSRFLQKFFSLILSK